MSKGISSDADDLEEVNVELEEVQVELEDEEMNS
jgi:hypothetical protein